MRKENYEHITTGEHVRAFETSSPVFSGLLAELRELSKKKPETSMSQAKVKIVNRVLDDLLALLKTEPEAKYLELLSDEALPQMSDAVLVMCQFEVALQSFRSRYRDRVDGEIVWIVEELF